MRTYLRVAAVIFALVIVAFWFFGGPNMGWTKTSVMRLEKDPVTELEKRVYDKRFVPGVDFLAKGLATAAVLAGTSLLFRKHKEGTALPDGSGSPDISRARED